MISFFCFQVSSAEIMPVIISDTTALKEKILSPINLKTDVNSLLPQETFSCDKAPLIAVKKLINVCRKIVYT